MSKVTSLSEKSTDIIQVQNPGQLPVKHSVQNSAHGPVQCRFPAEQKRMVTWSHHRKRIVQESQKISG